MGLITERTRWVLFLSAEKNPEWRHIMDLAHGIYCLERAGVNISDISIYIDGDDRSIIESAIESGTSSSFLIKETRDFFDDMSTNTHDNIVMFITGHGCPNGIH